jgi:hypothetical protein
VEVIDMAKVKNGHVTIRDLQERGSHITPGDKYIPKSWLPKRDIPIEEVHKRLAKIQGNLADDIAQMRDQG